MIYPYLDKKIKADINRINKQMEHLDDPILPQKRNVTPRHKIGNEIIKKYQKVISDHKKLEQQIMNDINQLLISIVPVTESPIDPPKKDSKNDGDDDDDDTKLSPRDKLMVERFKFQTKAKRNYLICMTMLSYPVKRKN